MSSQGSSVDIFERLAEWSSEEIENNIGQIVNELLSYLNGEDRGLVLQAVYALLVTCLPTLPIKDADKSLLHRTMPAVQLLFQESMEGIKLRLNERSQSDVENTADTLSSLLQVCVELLKCMECVLEYIVSQGRINISSVPNVPKIVALLILQTFRHCKESEALYEELFSAVADVLGAVFRQCHQVQCRFFAVMSANITFDSSVDSDIAHLVDVLQILSEVGEQVMSLDIKSMAEQWKGYSKIIQLYVEPLRDRLNIAYPINYLCLEIKRNLEQLVCQEFSKDLKGISRLFKTTSFILKIVVKLCEQFGCGDGCLRKCSSGLYDLLLALHRHSSPLLVAQNIERSGVDEILRNLTIAADPLLSHIICEAGFREELLKRCAKVCSIPNDRLPHLLLVISVMKRIITLNVGEKDLWLGGTEKNNIIGCVLAVLKHSHPELSSDVWLTAIVKAGEAPRRSDLYEALCSCTAGLVLSLNTDQFQKVECMLLDCIVEPFLWPALFCMDVWCICARAGSSELVVDQVLYFSDIALSFEPTSLTERLECQIISLFIRRLSSFLGTKGKQALVEKFPPLDYPLMWHIFGLQSLPKEMKDTVSQEFVSNCVTCIDQFLSENVSVTYFNQMMLSLCGLSASLDYLSSRKAPVDTQMSDIVQKVISLWQYAYQGNLRELLPSNHFLAGQKWLCKLFGILCKCTGNLVQVMNNKEILQVLNSIENFISCCSSSVKLSLMHILHGMATKTLDATSDQNLVCSKISNLFSHLLEDPNELVKEATLETFEYFAHFTAHECVVAEAVSGNTMIQEVVTSYLQKEVPSVESANKLFGCLEYFTFQGKILTYHKCEDKKHRTSSPKCPENPTKKIRLDCDDSTDLSAFLADDLFTEFAEKDVSDVINRIAKDSQYIISQCIYEALPAPLKTDLKKAVEDLDRFMKL